MVADDRGVLYCLDHRWREDGPTALAKSFDGGSTWRVRPLASWSWSSHLLPPFQWVLITEEGRAALANPRGVWMECRSPIGASSGAWCLVAVVPRAKMDTPRSAARVDGRWLILGGNDYADVNVVLPNPEHGRPNTAEVAEGFVHMMSMGDAWWALGLEGKVYISRSRGRQWTRVATLACEHRRLIGDAIVAVQGRALAVATIVPDEGEPEPEDPAVPRCGDRDRTQPYIRAAFVAESGMLSPIKTPSGELQNVQTGPDGKIWMTTLGGVFRREDTGDWKRITPISWLTTPSAH
jgi:hypothetical protein